MGNAQTGVTDMKKCLALLLALVTALSVLTVAVTAADTEPLLVEDLLKLDTDADTGVCRTIEIFIQRQFRHYDSTKEITFCDAYGNTAAICRPHADNICLLDLYTPEGDFGVRIDPTRLYYLIVPEGAYYTDDGVLCEAYRGEYNGVFLSDRSRDYTVADLGIDDFLATHVRGRTLFAGRIRISRAFDSYRPVNTAVTLLRRIAGTEDYAVVCVCPVTDFRKGSADVNFGGVEIDRYASYKLRVDYGTFFGPKQTVNGSSEYVLSGKRLLGLREDYPAIDLLIRWFGADHPILKDVTNVLDFLARIGLADKALVRDVKEYISARKGK